MEYYSDIKKKNEFLPFVATQTDLEGIKQIEISLIDIVWYHLYMESKK